MRFSDVDDDDDDDVVDFLFRSIIHDSLVGVLLWPAVSVLSFVFCLLAVYPLGLFVCLCSLSIFSHSNIIMLTRSFRRWRSCNPGVFVWF